MQWPGKGRSPRWVEPPLENVNANVTRLSGETVVVAALSREGSTVPMVMVDLVGKKSLLAEGSDVREGKGGNMVLRYAIATRVGRPAPTEIGEQWGSEDVIVKKTNASDMFLRLVFVENGLFVHKEVEWVPKAFVVAVAVVANKRNSQLNGMIGGLPQLVRPSPNTPIASMSPETTILWHQVRKSVGRHTALLVADGRARRLYCHTTDLRGVCPFDERVGVGVMYVCLEDEGQE